MELFEYGVFLLQKNKAVDAEAVFVPGFNINPFFVYQPDAAALALRDAAGLALEGSVAAGTVFYFVFMHTIN